MRGKRTAASGQDREGAVGKTLKMRALTLKSKAGSKRWLTSTLPPPPHSHKHTDSLSLSQKRSPRDETTPHYKGHTKAKLCCNCLCTTVCVCAISNPVGTVM